MTTDTPSKSDIEILGVGTHNISFDVVDDSVKDRVIECIMKNGKISIQVGAAELGRVGTFGFEQRID